MTTAVPGAPPPSPTNRRLSYSRGSRVFMLLSLAVSALGVGVLAGTGNGLPLVALFVLCAVAIWAAPRPAVLPLIMFGVLILPTPAITTERFHGIPPATSLGVATLGAVLFLWLRQRRLSPEIGIPKYALASLLILLVASIAQLGLSDYAQIKDVYQNASFWLAGLLLGSVVASDDRMTLNLGVAALPLAFLAIAELFLKTGNLWGKAIGATGYENITAHTFRAVSTFGHPLVAGATLTTIAFLVINRPARDRSILFSVLVAGGVATVSRSTYVGLFAGLLVHFAGSNRNRSQLIGAIIVTAAAIWLMLAVIPSLNTSFDSRILGAGTQTESIRLNSYRIVANDFTQGNSELLTGRGIGGSVEYLARTGENLGFNTYDNQYITSIFDSGLMVILLVATLIVTGIVRSRPNARMLAPFVVSAATMLFFDGLYWPVTGLLFWMTVALASTPQTARPNIVL